MTKKCLGPLELPLVLLENCTELQSTFKTWGKFKKKLYFIRVTSRTQIFKKKLLCALRLNKQSCYLRYKLCAYLSTPLKLKLKLNVILQKLV